MPLLDNYSGRHMGLPPRNAEEERNEIAAFISFARNDRHRRIAAS